MKFIKNKRFRAALWLAAGTVLSVNAVWAASILDFDIWMRRIDRRVVDVQKKMALRDDAAAIAQAREIEDLYKKMEDYFVASGDTGDAVKLSREGKELAALIATSVAAQDYDAGSNAAIGIAKACTNCHEAYRPFK